MRHLFYLIFFLCNSWSLFSQTTNPLVTKDALAQQQWVDSLYNQMTLEEKVGQLFMVQAFSNQGLAHENIISQLITKHHIGGIDRKSTRLNSSHVKISYAVFCLKKKKKKKRKKQMQKTHYK